MSAHDSYLETTVRTASPQRLRLLLIDGALTSARQTLEHWKEDSGDKAFESLVRCRRIVAELLSAVRADGSPLASQVTQIYAVLFRTLTEAQAGRDRRLLRQVIDVLEIERETWRALCEQLPEAPPADLEGRRREIICDGAAIPLSPPRMLGRGGPASGPRLSLEA